MSSPIILASQSPQRQAILTGLGIDFEVQPAELNEAAHPEKDPLQRAVALAMAKAQTVADLHPDRIVLAADTYVVCQGEVLEKPVDLDDARRMLQQLAGQPAQEVSGVAYIDPVTGFTEQALVVVKFAFRQLSAAEIERYVIANPVLTWSAAFSPAYPAGAALIDWVEGSMTGFTHGLPIGTIVPWLWRSGVWE